MDSDCAIYFTKNNDVSVCVCVSVFSQDECRSANSYELTYNAGCVALYQQRYREAEDFLDLALGMMAFIKD